MSTFFIINAANKAKIENLLNNVQKRAQVRTFDIVNIYNFPRYIEKYKENHNISWAALEDCVFDFDTYVTMPNCYDYQITYTLVQIIVKKGKCRIYNIERQKDYNKRTNAHRNQISFLTEKAKIELIKNACYM